MKTLSVLLRPFVLVLFLLAPTLVLAADPTVLRVIAVQTDSPDTYLKEIEKGRAMFKRLGVPAEVRVWKGRFAGDEAGAIVVSIEFPSLVALAEAEARLSADSEYMAWLKQLDKVRKIVSDSLYSELGP